MLKLNEIGLGGGPKCANLCCPKKKGQYLINKAVGPGKNPKLINLGPMFILDYRVHVILKKIVSKRALPKN